MYPAKSDRKVEPNIRSHRSLCAMKMESSLEEDPVAAATVALAQATSDMQKAIAAAHKARSPALVAAEATIASLETAARRQKHEHTATRTELLTLLRQKDAARATRAMDREALEKEQDVLKKASDALRLERASLAADRAKFAVEKRESLKDFRRTVGVMQAELAKQERNVLARGPAVFPPMDPIASGETLRKKPERLARTRPYPVWYALLLLSKLDL
ncbi:hypothetical protein C8J57DRAFT_1226180 [Mycena rebaudengoi]|nr:hypothetical protein C8J57DRAFT_1226180 [Mycena rebaudengoi]